MNMLDLIPGGIANFIAFVLLFMPITEFFFRGRKLNLIELGLISLVISTITVPLFAWLLNFIMPFSITLVGIVLAVPLFISAFLLLTKKVSLQPHHTQFSKASIIVLALFLISFYLRLQSLSAYFYEFDPYYYMVTPEFLLTQGHVPLHDDLAYALTPIGHRNLPAPQYLTAVWYMLTYGPGHYNHLDNSLIANIYPPLLGALLVFLAYFLFREEYTNFIAVVAAFVIAFMPILFSKFFAGVAEQLPWGIYAAAAALVFIYLAVKYRENRWYYLLAIFGVLGAFLGSKAGMIPIVIGAAFFTIKAAYDFVNGDREKVYYELPLLLAAVVSVANFLVYNMYISPAVVSAATFFPSEAIVLLLAGIFSFFTYHLLDIGRTRLDTLRKRAYALCGLGLLSVIFLITPLGAPVLEYGIGLAGVGGIGPSSALVKTVAEETLHGDDISPRFGYAGISFDISRFTSTFISKYGSLNALPVVYVLLFFSLIYGFFYRKSSLILLLSIFIFSLSFIGLQKVKYTPHLGLLLGLAVCAVAAEAYYAQKEKGIPKYIGFGAGVVLILISLIAILAYAGGFIGFFTKGGSIPFYSLSDPLYYLAFAATAAALLYFAYTYFNEKRWDAVLGISVMFLFLPFALNNIEVLPYSLQHNTVDLKDHTAVSQMCANAGSSFYAKNFYCNIIPAYWYDSMMWLKSNMDNDSYLFSWWDYGHWTNHFARKKTFTRNDHPFVILDLEVADKFVAKNESVMASYMKSHNSNYILMDIDLVGKWGALTYLSCVYNNETSAEDLPSESKCSFEYQFERIYVPQKPTLSQMCTIGQQYGVVGYSSFGTRIYCTQVINNQYMVIFDQQTGRQVSAVPMASGVTAMQGSVYTEYLMIYTKDGIADAPGRGYNSNFYKGFFLGELDGYTQVYPADRVGFGVVPIRIYKRNG